MTGKKRECAKQRGRNHWGSKYGRSAHRGQLKDNASKQLACAMCAPVRMPRRDTLNGVVKDTVWQIYDDPVEFFCEFNAAREPR